MKHILILTALVFSYQVQAQYKVCLYSNGKGADPLSGHSFVTLETTGSKTPLETYGYYPENVGNFSDEAFLRTYDQRLSETRLVELHGRTALQERFCQPIKAQNRKLLKAYSEAYLEAYPQYNALNRNCTVFAKMAYTYMTGDRVQSSGGPVGLARLMRKAKKQSLDFLEDASKN